MKISYTESGRKELDRFMAEQVETLEKYLRIEKSVLGDTELEITGADIQKIKPKLKPFLFKQEKILNLKKISYIYIFLGLILVLSGFSYPYLELLVYENSFQAIMILIGIVCLVFGTFGMLLLVIKKNQLPSATKRENLLNQLNKMFVDDEDTEK